MDFELTEDQKQIKTLVREFCQREVDQKRITEILRKNDAAKTREVIRANYPYDLGEKAHKAGLLTIGIPTKYGGPGPDTGAMMTMAIAMEEAFYSAGLAGQLVVGPPFNAHAMRKNPYVTEREREEYFSLLLEYSKLRGGGTVSEPSGTADIHLGYDEGGSQILQVTARKDGNGWVLNGDKMWSSAGVIADFVEVLARTKEGPISESASLFEGVPMDAPGVTQAMNKLIFTDFSGNCSTHYDNVWIPESALLGQLHSGYKQLAWNFQYKWTAAPYGLGTLRRLYEHMYDFAKQRIGGGKPIIQHTSVAEKLGDLAMRIEALGALWYKTAWETDRMEEAGRPGGNWYWHQSCMVFMKQTCWRFCEVAHEIYGSMAGVEDFPIENFMRFVYQGRAGTLAINMGLIKVCQDFENRYYYM